MSVVLEARDITKVYGHVSALAGANFEVRAGEVAALIGDNGAGKSTLVKILSGTETPTSGEILFRGEDLAVLSGRALKNARRRIGSSRTRVPVARLRTSGTVISSSSAARARPLSVAVLRSGPLPMTEIALVRRNMNAPPGSLRPPLTPGPI